MFTATALFRIASSSDCCSQVLSPAFEGQSIFATVAIQIARNSRGTVGASGSWPRAAAATRKTSAEMVVRGFIGIVKWGISAARKAGSYRLTRDVAVDRLFFPENCQTA